MNRVLLILVCILSVPLAFAQFDSGSVLGTVRDKSGAVVPGASIRLTNTSTGVSIEKATDGNGSYEFFTVRVGSYRINGEKDGFTRASVEDFQVDIGARQRVDLVLAVGSAVESIEVNGGATDLETDSSQHGQVVTREQAVQLPLNGREYSALVTLTTGVRLSTLNTGSSSTLREGSFNINGLRSTFNNFLLDGVDNNAYGTSNQGFSNQVMQPPPDAIAEFKVVTNNMSAEYGRSGGATVNVAYASGGNQFHGNVWEFVRNTSLNATGYFKPVNGTGKPPLHRNQFGFTFGGPISKNRAFFFLDYEGFRQIRKFTAFATLPSLSERSGILAVPVRNPITGATYVAGAPVPMTPFAQTVMNALPTPTNQKTANNYQVLQAFRNFNDKYDAKFDLPLTSKTTGFLRVGQRKANLLDQPVIPLPDGGDSNGHTRVLNQQLAAGLTWARTANQLLEVRLGISRTQAGKSPLNLGTDSTAFGIGGLPTDPRVAGGLPSQLITGFSNLGRQATNPQWQYPTVFDPKVNYSLTLSRHSLKVGYEFQRVNTEVEDVNPLYGRDGYSGQFSRPAGGPANPSEYNLADFFFGLRNQYALSNFFVANLRQNLHFAYVQDDWKFNDRLTLNLGVRYEYATPFWERDNKLTNFDPAHLTMVQASGNDRYLVDPDKNNFAPRIGFAYSVNSKMVIRSAYGVNYVHFNRAGAANLLPINAPQVINGVVTQSDPKSASFRLTQQGYPAGFTDPSQFDPLKTNITYIPKNSRTGYVQSWLLSVQEEIAKGTTVDLAYVGNRANKMLLFGNFNQAFPNNPAGTLALQARRPIPTFSDITYAFNGGFSTYNSLQARFDHRFRHGFQLLNSFTWSKAIDNGAGSLENPNGNFPSPENIYNMAADKAVSAYDQPFNNTTSFVWDVPVGAGRQFMGSMSPWMDAVLGGWQISGVNTMTSGQPINLLYTPTSAMLVSGIQQDFRGAIGYRPNVPGDPRTHTDNPLNYLDPNMVKAPTDPSQPFGNASRNSVRGYAFYQTDLAVGKNFKLTERTQLQFRSEFFNLFNKTNLSAPNSNISSGAAFGQITSSFDPRQVQFGLKVSF